MTGSTLYRRLPDGTWAAEREDLLAGAPGLAPAMSAPAMAAPAMAAPAMAAPAMAAATASGGAPTVSGPAGAGAPPLGAPPAGAPVGPPPQAPRRRHRGLRLVAAVAALVLFAVVAWGAALVLHAGSSLNNTASLATNPIADTPGQVWLLVGSDSRAGLTKKERKALHTGADEGSQRTDTIMLVHFQPGQDPTLVSIPRDSWVTIPAHTATNGTEVGEQQAKINAAYAYGGSALLASTIEANTGLHVDHVMEIGMGGIVDITDAVGGVDVCFEKAITDENSGLDVPAGCQTLDGKQALAWVRMRYADPRGDLGRMERQQKWVSLVLHRALAPGILLNPARQWQVLDAGLSSLVVDQGTGVVDLTRLGLGLRQIMGGSGEITSIPVDDTDHWEDGQWVIHWDTAQADELFASMGAGQ